MNDALDNHVGSVSIGGKIITNLRFADDIDGLAGSESELANLIKIIDNTACCTCTCIWNGNKLYENTNNGKF